MLNRFKKHCMVALLAAGMVLGATAGAQAIDFKAKGQWLVSFGLGDGNFTQKNNRGNYTSSSDYFAAGQRVRLQLDAVASEALSGTVWFEIGRQEWGYANEGGALGADGIQVKVKNAYLDWIVPQTDLKFRMGIQAVKLPNAAGGTAIFDADVAGITASYQFNDNVGLTAFWYRPLNDNNAGWVGADGDRRERNYLDNLDVFGFALPLTFDGVKVTPWFLYGAMGRNALNGYNVNGGAAGWNTADGKPASTLLGTYDGAVNQMGRAKHAYSNMFFVGLPVVVNAWDPLNIEFDFNYGYVEGFGRYDIVDNRANDIDGNQFGTFNRRANTKRSGWLAKALVEYKLDWGVPGIFGWYSSGDDGNARNGSERMPAIAGGGSFTSFMGQAGIDFAAHGGNRLRGSFHEKNLTYAGTWGIGAQIRDMSFLEDLKHTFRVAYWGGTNSTKMTKYFNTSSAWDVDMEQGPYLTTNDGLIEFNLDTKYKVYENLDLYFDLGYIVNCMNKGTWDRRWMNNGNGTHYQKKDAWKAELVFAYSF